MSNQSKFWVGALIVGAVATGALVANRNRVEVAPVAPIAAPEAEPLVTKAALPTRVRKAPEPAFVVTVGLGNIVKPLLQNGTDLTLASEGFRTDEAFVATAHAAKNLGIPFVVLKDRVVAQRMSLAAAILEIRPEVNAKAEAARAIAEARAEISRPS